jgi:2-polyprenyl-6-hydroxyphenyl methylase/3-demethylubiquinone-9 3-methyltransferase
VGVYDDPRSVLEGGLYDCVVSTEVIEHLYAPQKLPVFASQVLRPEGWLIVSAPYHGYLKNLVWSVFNYWDVHPAEQYMF